MAQAEEKLTDQIRARRNYAGPSFLKQGFRPFFLAAGVWGAAAMLLWVIELTTEFSLPLFNYLAPVEWHMHEMLFGFASAGIAGFLLTAIPNWTGRLPVRGTPLMLLALLWLAGRLAMLIAGMAPAGLHPALALTDVLFLAVLTFVLGREIVSSQNWRNLKVIIVIALLALCHMAFHLGALDLLPLPSSSEIAFAAILLITILLNIIGGRVVPSFTRNWLSRRGEQPPAPRDRFDDAGDYAVGVAALLLLVLPGSKLTALVALGAAALQFYRLSRWRTLSVSSEPIVLVLHVGFLWMGLGFALAGLSIISDFIPRIAAIHAFTAGLMGTMLVAVMTRATRGHSGNPLIADAATIQVYALVSLAALSRVGSAIFGFTEVAYLISGLCWIAAFTLFAIRYLPMFLSK